MKYLLALIPTRYHDRTKAIVGLVGITLTIVSALVASPALAIVLGVLTSAGIYQAPNVEMGVDEPVEIPGT